MDQALVSFSADVDWAKQNGAKVERFNLAQQPQAFAENALAKALLEKSGQEGFPLILVDGQQVDCVYVMEATDSTATSMLASHAQAALGALAQSIESAGIRGDHVVLQGKASSEIARYASSQYAKLIVVEKRGQNPLVSLVIGSTAANLCEIAGCPVLMVP